MEELVAYVYDVQKFRWFSCWHLQVNMMNVNHFRHFENFERSEPVDSPADKKLEELGIWKTLSGVPQDEIG